MIDAVSTVESPLKELEGVVNRLLDKLDELRDENQRLHKKLQTQQLIGEQLAQKNSRAGEAIKRLISSIEGSPA
jgi:uncharacterized protein (TIGR02449 family)